MAGTMKAAILSAVLGLALLLPAAAAETRVRLSAKTVSSSRDTDNLWKTDYGSYDRNVYQIRFIAVEAQCTQGEEKGKIIVQWIGKNKAKNSDAELLKRDEAEIDLKAGATLKREFNAAFAESDANYKALGERDREGHRYGGWIVRILDSKGNLLAEQSSSQPYLKKFSLEATPPKVPGENDPK